MVKRAHPKPKKRTRKPEQFRQCLLTGDRLSKAQMIRFVVGPDGKIVADLKAKLPGRGLWLTARRDCLEQAIKKRRFSSAAKCAVEVPGAIGDDIERLLARNCLNLFGLAQKSGLLATGFEKVLEWVDTKALTAAIEATDGQPDGRKKVLNRLVHQPGDVLVIGCFSRDELSLALGRENVVHAALETSSLAKTIRTEIGRLEGFRDLIPRDWSDGLSSLQKNEAPNGDQKGS